MGDPTFFVDATTVTAREAEVTAADFDNGMNNGACQPGIGINMAGGAVIGEPQQFTLEDQDEDIRVPQVGQYIGGDGLGGTYPSSGGVAGKGTVGISTGTLPTNAAKAAADPSIDGTVILTGDANLQTLSAGWVAVAV